MPTPVVYDRSPLAPPSGARVVNAAAACLPVGTPLAAQNVAKGSSVELHSDEVFRGVDLPPDAAPRAGPVRARFWPVAPLSDC